MAVQVTVNNITGSTPYDVYLCDTSQTTCIYINQITDSQLPYNFILYRFYEAIQLTLVLRRTVFC